MSIDEAIEKYREKGNPYGTCCEGCEKEHEQLAEWLEELKSYRAHIFSGDMTQAMLKEQYCKAIDDFAEKMKELNETGEISVFCWNRIVDEIAEQLKVGGENDNSNSF